MKLSKKRSLKTFKGKNSKILYIREGHKKVYDDSIENVNIDLEDYYRSQMIRVIDLSEALEKLEDNLIKQSIESEEIDSELLIKVIKIIQKSLDSSLDSVKQVISNKNDITKLANRPVGSNQVGKKVNSGIQMHQDSRDKIRIVMNNILEAIEIKDINNDEIK